MQVGGERGGVGGVDVPFEECAAGRECSRISNVDKAK